MRLAAERPLSTTKVRILLYAAVVLFGTEFATPALAQTFPMSITCTSFGETCTPAFSTPVTVASPGPLTITVTASPTHCSNVGYTVSVDGTAITTTPFLTPGQTSAAMSCRKATAKAGIEPPIMLCLATRFAGLRG